ncbi:unnamed protein product [Sphagnum troendelagicum]
MSRVLARGRVLVRRLLAGKPSCRGFDAILLPHDFAATDSDQRISQLLDGLLNERQHLEPNELDRVVGAPDVVDLAHLLVADEEALQVAVRLAVQRQGDGDVEAAQKCRQQWLQDAIQLGDSPYDRSNRWRLVSVRQRNNELLETNATSRAQGDTTFNNVVHNGILVLAQNGLRILGLAAECRLEHDLARGGG